jgi:hypothetical protein
MIINSSLTIFHKGYDATTRLEKWIRFNYDKVWFFGGKGAGINKGYDNANDFDCRIPYDLNPSLDAKDFSIGDIVVNDTINYDISSDDELDAFDTFNITSINDNNFGATPHIHIGGK